MSEVSARGTAALTTYRFDFLGRTGEYFRIWVVSLFLSVVTLGIYSAWGKVRKKRYLYSHTELDGTGFEFRATPLAILRGRVIALVLLGGFALSGHVLPIMQLVFIIILLALTPWIVVAASRFNARNSAWRNITFSFNGGFWEAARVFLALGLLAVVTLGLAYPYARMRRARFIIEHHRYGDTQIRADLLTGGFILAYLLAALMFIGIMVLFVAAMVGMVFAAGAAAPCTRSCARKSGTLRSTEWWLARCAAAAPCARVTWCGCISPTSSRSSQLWGWQRPG